ncbi:MAG: hypothetical protein HPY50_00100 [Firmicutes bacterium]|nr:hypothetical protein [Bacillota bacterium]
MTGIIVYGIIRALGWIILFSLAAKIWPRFRRIIEEYRRLNQNRVFAAAKIDGKGLTRGGFIKKAVLSLALDTAIIIALVFVLVIK